MNSKKLSVKSKKEKVAFGDHKNSPILLHDRCTSTPLGQNRLSFSRLDTSIGRLDISRDARSTPKMDVSAGPIFGRQNLLSYYQKSGDQSGTKNILKKHDIKPHMDNIDQTFDDKSKPSSSGLHNTKEESKETKRKILGNKRKSMHNDSRGPVFKTTSKRPKSPRLLTEMRAKLKMNRDRLKTVHNEVARDNDKKTTANEQKNVKQIRPSQKTTSATVYNKYKITIPMTPKFRRTKSPCHI